MGPKPTSVDLETLKQALSDLKALQSAMGNGTGGAYAQLANATDVTDDLGPLIDSAGMQISTYINARANAIREAIHTSGRGVGAAITMLDNTIKNYEKHEHNTTASANNTASGSTSSDPGKK